ncbi:hypothetical protein DHW03_16565 [Pedobacter yonginense]|uniref:Acyltransferase 3 domain-containing protein n=1 Tax=Pedobacter yonginense TaxID=651869 RepID=A0A317EKM6_9SPHI|nr:acyltransferase [Pedobacter yonginense]PWS26393.1 hypothetical protein DHW03_16565 [Pedobacter yonginense]
MMVRSDDHIPILDFLRAFASLSVCIVHMSLATDLQHYPIHNLLAYGQQGVPIFFVISGFVVPYSLWNVNYQTSNFFRFIEKRLIRIGIPFSITVITFAIFEPQFSILKFIYNLFYLVPFTNSEWYSSVFWTLGVEFQFYILIGLLFYYIRNGNKYILMSTLIFLGFLGPCLKLDERYMLLVHNLHYFVFGMLVLLIKKKKISLVEGHAMLVILTLFLCFKVAIVTGLIGYLTAVAILHLNFKIIFSKWLGKISYSLYLTHILTADLILIILSKLTINPYLLFIILILGCIFGASMFYIIFERTALKWSKKISVT